MMITIKFHCDSSAFEEQLRGQINHILHDAAYKIMVQLDRPASLCDEPEWADVLRDVNGNKVGVVEVDQ